MPKYFEMKEFRCPCKGCESRPLTLNLMHPRLLHRLNTARDYLCMPITISSGARCEKHNKTVGGSPTSSHLAGLAVDIVCTSSPYRHALVKYLIGAGFTRIGIAETFVHVDVDSSKTQGVMWVY